MRHHDRRGIWPRAVLAFACMAFVSPAIPAAEPAPLADQTSVRQLLDDAASDMRAMRLTAPPGNNALDRYRRVLELSPDNAEAADGLFAIVRRYVGLADDAIARERYDRAAEFLDRADAVLPGNELAALSREDLDRRRARTARSLTLGSSAAPSQGAAARAPAPALSSSPAPAPALASTPAPATAAAPEIHRLAIFPFETIVSCFVPVGKKVRRSADRFVASRADAEIVWSYYAPGVNEQDIPPPDQVWTDNRAHPEPATETVQRAGRAVGASTVLMAWYSCYQTERITSDHYKVTVFVVDVATGKVLSQENTLDFADDLVDALLTETWSR